jgi:hypothetical protein
VSACSSVTLVASLSACSASKDAADNTSYRSRSSNATNSAATAADTMAAAASAGAVAAPDSGRTDQAPSVRRHRRTVGPNGPEAILARIGDASRNGIDLVTVGVGTTSYNDEMMERLADGGNGFSAYAHRAVRSRAPLPGPSRLHAPDHRPQRQGTGRVQSR